MLISKVIKQLVNLALVSLQIEIDRFGLGFGFTALN